jgi:hypothetical protein
MPTIKKNQIRPRRIKVHFTNTEILLFDTTGFLQLVNPAGLGTFLVIDSMEIRTKIVQVYGNDDATGFFAFNDDSANFVAFVENDMGISTGFSDLFVNTGLNIYRCGSPGGNVDSFNEVVSFAGQNWTDEADLQANGGITAFFSNNGADLNGGDPANFMDVFLEYHIVNL